MKNALVTGSTRGIGRAIADKLSQNGYNVLKNGRTGGDIQADLSSIEGVSTLADEVIKRTNRLDCLVLNAGTTLRKPFADITPDEWQHVMNVNLNMPVFLVQHLSNHIQDGGIIVFISSDMAIYPHATSLAYGVSKAAVVALTRNLVKEFAPRKIRVNSICPGFIDTEWQKEKPERLREGIESKIALKRFGIPEEIADACLCLIDNNYINGALLQVDGGYDYM